MTVETEVTEKGVIDGLDRVLRQLMRSEKFKETVLLFLRSIDPASARRLVRTLFWEDAGMLMSFLGSLPDIVNTVLQALDEVLTQFGSMPTGLVQEFVKQILSGLDGAAMGEAAGGLLSLLLTIGEGGEGLKETLDSLGKDFYGGYRKTAPSVEPGEAAERLVAAVAGRAKDEGSGTHALVQGAKRAMEKNPDFAEHVLRPLLSQVLPVEDR